MTVSDMPEPSSEVGSGFVVLLCPGGHSAGQLVKFAADQAVQLTRPNGARLDSWPPADGLSTRPCAECDRLLVFSPKELNAALSSVVDSPDRDEARVTLRAAD